MRGKVVKILREGSGNRITPAYAGKRFPTSCRCSAVQDHPRLCGEKIPEIVQHIKDKGSPPPMRGKASGTFKSLFSSGITPAYAGKRGLCHYDTSRHKDHPRLCGEKTQGFQIHIADEGSPPPMRGKVDPFRHRCRQTGITPAYAGKSTFQHLHTSCNRDHPRLCGEKTKKIPKQRYFFHQPASFSFSLQYT